MESEIVWKTVEVTRSWAKFWAKNVIVVRLKKSKLWDLKLNLEVQSQNSANKSRNFELKKVKVVWLKSQISELESQKYDQKKIELKILSYGIKSQNCEKKVKVMRLQVKFSDNRQTYGRKC